MSQLDDALVDALRNEAFLESLGNKPRKSAGEDSQLRVAALAQSPAAFLIASWSVLNLHDKAPLGYLESDIMEYICNDYEPQVRCVMGFRQGGKSHISPCANSWLAFRDPSWKFVTIGSSEGLGKDTLRKMRGLLRSCWWLQHMQPHEGDKDNEEAFQFGNIRRGEKDDQPSVLAMGITGSLASKRAHVVDADDLEQPTNTLTIDARNRLHALTHQFDTWMYVEPNPSNPAPTRIIYKGTYHAEDSLYTRKVLKDKGSMRSYPIRFPYGNEDVPYLAPYLKNELAKEPTLAGSPTVPYRFGIERVAEQEAKSKLYFRWQYLMMPGIGEGERRPLRLGDLMVMPLHRDQVPFPVMWGENDNIGSTAIDSIPNLSPDETSRYQTIRKPMHVGNQSIPYQGTRAHLDIAGAGADRASLGICSLAAGMFFVKRLYIFEGGFQQEKLDQIARWCREQGVTTLRYESNADPTGAFGHQLSGAFLRLSVPPNTDPLLPQGWTCAVEPVHVTKQKQLRIIDTIENLLNTHKIVVDPQVLMPQCPGHPEHEFQFQFTNITRERNCIPHDDAVDAFAGCLGAWTDLNQSLSLQRSQLEQHASKAKEEAHKARMKRLDSMAIVAPQKPETYTPVWRGE